MVPEHRCSPYDRHDDPYPQSVEARIVAVSEAHDSGLCAASASTRRRFASDLLNLTLAAPKVSRCGRFGKCAKGAAEWLPSWNRHWFANRVVEVRREYRLTIDHREAGVLERILSGCKSTAMAFHADSGAAVSADPPDSGDVFSGAVDMLARWDDNRNGRISCKEARRHRIASVGRGHPAYPFMRDRDGDGVVCE